MRVGAEVGLGCIGRSLIVLNGEDGVVGGGGEALASQCEFQRKPARSCGEVDGCEVMIRVVSWKIVANRSDGGDPRRLALGLDQGRWLKSRIGCLESGLVGVK